MVTGSPYQPTHTPTGLFWISLSWDHDWVAAIPLAPGRGRGPIALDGEQAESVLQRRTVDRGVVHHGAVHGVRRVPVVVTVVHGVRLDQGRLEADLAEEDPTGGVPGAEGDAVGGPTTRRGPPGGVVDVGAQIQVDERQPPDRSLGDVRGRSMRDVVDGHQGRGVDFSAALVGDGRTIPWAPRGPREWRRSVVRASRRRKVMVTRSPNHPTHSPTGVFLIWLSWYHDWVATTPLGPGRESGTPRPGR